MKIGKLWNDSAFGNVSEFIYTFCGEILADSEDSDEIFRKLQTNLEK